MKSFERGSKVKFGGRCYIVTHAPGDTYRTGSLSLAEVRSGQYRIVAARRLGVMKIASVDDLSAWSR